MYIKFNTKNARLVIVLALIVLSVVAFYTLSDSRTVVFATTNDTQASPAQQDPVSVMYAASLIKTFENSLA